MDEAMDNLLDLPSMVDKYHSLMPLEEMQSASDEVPSAALGVRSTVLKGINMDDGGAYALRRIDGRQVLPTGELLGSSNSTMHRWGKVQHPGIVPLRRVFVSRDLEESSALYFAYEYVAAAVTVESAYLSPSPGTSPAQTQLSCSEALLWSFACQLTSVLRALHTSGLAAYPGALHPSKVLLISRSRIALGSGGLPQILAREDGSTTDTSHQLPVLMGGDLAAAGLLLLTLACGPGCSMPSLSLMARHYSADMVQLVGTLLEAGTPGGIREVGEVMHLLADHLMVEMDQVHLYSDAVQRELSKEVENGRLLRLLIKLGQINERPDLDRDASWSETGDRYLLKLFRDWVFHRSTDTGTPDLEWGNIVEALNKLDAGVPEKILLMSRDEMSMLVVSYRDLKRCMETVYSELQMKAQTQAQQAQAQAQQAHGPQPGMHTGHHRR
ncbi:hypothetical protein CYMTET_52367 [Cymbomonas tetramitiformis]|uniref:Pan3 C-terminal knob domain-containing protein n=1 Tax=Cymbomonas tetramitiformis TaxID=36881 RepID=A0AAE0BKZ2_9CHLO|nr:hypothetical protein CYMTET_52367 [Cymbomonas tetramitiformis]